MGMMLPNELIWVMEKLGFDWPDIDEDELRRGGHMVGVFRTELEGKLQAMDRKVNGDLAAAMRGQAGPAYVGAWNTNRSQNLQRLVDILGPVPAGVEVAAGGVFALKMKVIFDVTTTMIALVGMLTNPVTAVGAGPMLIIKKKLLNAAVDIAVEQVLNQVLPMVIEPLVQELPGIVMAALDSPIVEAVAGDPDEFGVEVPIQCAEAWRVQPEGRGERGDALRFLRVGQTQQPGGGLAHDHHITVGQVQGVTASPAINGARRGVDARQHPLQLPAADGSVDPAPDRGVPADPDESAAVRQCDGQLFVHVPQE